MAVKYGQYMQVLKYNLCYYIKGITMKKCPVGNSFDVN